MCGHVSFLQGRFLALFFTPRWHCVACAIVKGDHDCGLAQGDFHGVTVRHQEEEEGEVEQEVERQEEENAQTPVRMSMDGMK